MGSMCIPPSPQLKVLGEGEGVAKQGFPSSYNHSPIVKRADSATTTTTMSPFLACASIFVDLSSYGRFWHIVALSLISKVDGSKPRGGGGDGIDPSNHKSGFDFIPLIWHVAQC